MLLAHHLIIPFPLIPLLCISRRKKNLLYSQQLSLHITQVHNYNCTKAGREALRAKEDKEELRVKCAPLSAVWCAESSRPTRAFVQERKRHKRGSCRCQLVMTHTRGRAEGRAAPSRALTAAPGEETSGGACFQRASLHYHSHSSGALQTMALNIHGKPTFIIFHPSPTRPNIMQIESLCSKFWIEASQQSRIPMYITRFIFCECVCVCVRRPLALISNSVTLQCVLSALEPP